MFTLITLLVLALIAGATFTVKKVLNKKKEVKEESERLKSVYTPEVLKAFKDCEVREIHYMSGRQSGKSALQTTIVEHLNNCRICIKVKPEEYHAMRRKKITKSKHTKRFI